MAHSMFNLTVGQRVVIDEGPDSSFTGVTGTVIGSQIYSASYGELSVRYDRPLGVCGYVRGLYPESALRPL
jgi:hypothetical protein